ncbi:hypothetical protein CJJ23_03015 [Mycoplasmopsis agassizii]|uniref:Uncharacterized protein n=1 Tax=Mycoplasmopsis agassizii TaxID=33922 RepID=A0A269TII9_9BACT|nr:hypothetical protein [Mycoplasmopsis agassizii]PAK21221.1 hypothetical protein CJJ23_03015 [Mycoplasmopsis agassizii]
MNNKKTNKKSVLIGLGITAATIVASAVIVGATLNKTNSNNSINAISTNNALQSSSYSSSSNNVTLAKVSADPSLLAKDANLVDVASFRQNGSYAKLNQVIQATLEFRETLIDIYAFEQSGKTKFAVLSAFAQGSGSSIEAYSQAKFQDPYENNSSDTYTYANPLKNQKLRVFTYEDNDGFWKLEKDYELLNSVVNQPNKWETSIPKDLITQTRVERYFVNVFSKVVVDNNNIILYGDAGGTAIFDNPGSNVNKLDWLGTTASGVSLAVGKSNTISMFLHKTDNNTSRSQLVTSKISSTDLSNENETALKAGNYTINTSDNGWTDTSIKTSLTSNYKNYLDNQWNTNAFIKLDNGNYLFGGSGEYLAVVSSSGSITSRSYGTFQTKEKFDQSFKNPTQTTYDSTNWHEKYTKDYANLWSSSINKFIKSNGKIYAIGGLNETGYIREISSTGQATSTTKTYTSSGALIDIVEDGNNGFIAISNKNVLFLNSSLSVTKTISAQQYLSASSGRDNVQFFTKILPSGDGNFTLLSREGDLRPSDLANSYLTTTGETSLFNNGKLLGVRWFYDNMYTRWIFSNYFGAGSFKDKPAFLYVQEPFLSAFNAKQFIPSFGGNPVVSSSSALTFIDKSGNLKSQNTNWGAPSFQDGLLRLSDLTSITNLINTADGGYISLHLDGSIRFLNEQGYQGAWKSTNKAKDQSDLTTITTINFDGLKTTYKASVKTLFANTKDGSITIPVNGSTVSVSSIFNSGANGSLSSLNLTQEEIAQATIEPITDQKYLMYTKKKVIVLHVAKSNITVQDVSSGLLSGNKEIKKVVALPTILTSTSQANEKNKLFLAVAIGASNATMKDVEVGLIATDFYESTNNPNHSVLVTPNKITKLGSMSGDFLDMFLDPVNGNLTFAYATATTTTNPTINFFSSPVANLDKFDYHSTVNYSHADNDDVSQWKSKASTNIAAYKAAKGNTLKMSEHFGRLNELGDIITQTVTVNSISDNAVTSSNSSFTAGQLLKDYNKDSFKTLIYNSSFTGGTYTSKNETNAMAFASGKSIGSVTFARALLDNTRVIDKGLIRAQATGGASGTNNPKYDSVKDKIQFSAQNKTAVDKVEHKLNLGDSQYNHFIKSDFKITHFIGDGYGGFYVAGQKTLIRLDSQFKVINYTYLGEFNGTKDNKPEEISSLSLDKLGNVVINSNLAKTVVLNPLLKTGFIQFATGKSLYAEFLDKQTKANWTAQQTSWFSTTLTTYDTDNTKATASSLAKLDKELIRVPDKEQAALAKIKFSGETDNLTIDESEVWKSGLEGFSATEVTASTTDEQNPYKKFYKDAQLEYSLEGWVNGSKQQVWVTSNSTTSAKEIFKKLLKPGVLSEGSYVLTPELKNNFTFDKVMVRFNKAVGVTTTTNKIFPEKLQAPYKLKNENFKDAVIIVSLINPTTTSANQSNNTQWGADAAFWNTLSSTPDANAFTIAKKDDKQELSNSNFKLELPSSLADLTVIKEKKIIVKYSKTDSSTDTDWKEDPSTVGAGNQGPLYVALFIADANQVKTGTTTADNNAKYKFKDYTFSGTSVTAVKGSNSNRSESRQIQSFGIPEYIGASESSHIKTSSFSGNTDSLTFNENLDGDLKTKVEAGVVEIVYAFVPSNFSTETTKTYTVATVDSQAVTNLSSISWFDKDALIKAVKEQSFASKLTPQHKIIARVRLKQGTGNDNKYIVSNQLKTVYSGYNDKKTTTPSEGNFSIVANESTAFAALLNADTTGIRLSGTTSEDLFVVSGATAFDFTNFAIKFNLEVGPTNTYEESTWKKLENNISSTSINLKSSKDAYARIQAKPGWAVKSGADTIKKIGLRTLTAIGDVQLSNLSDATKLKISGNLFHLTIEENDGLFSSATDGLNSVSAFKSNIEVAYKFDKIDGSDADEVYRNKTDFIKYIQGLPTDTLNKLTKDNIKATYITTILGREKFAIPNSKVEEFNKGVKPSLTNVKDFIKIADWVNSDYIKTNFSLLGDIEHLEIKPVENSAFDTTTGTTLGYKVQYGSWTFGTDSTATYAWSDAPPTSLDLTPLSNYSKWTVTEANSTTTKEITSINDANKFHRLGIRFVAVTKTEVSSSETKDIGLGIASSTATNDVQDNHGYQIDHTRIKQIIKLSNDYLKNHLKFKGDISKLNEGQTQTEFEKNAFPESITSEQRSQVEILYSFDDGTTWYTYENFLTQIKAYQSSNSGPLTFSNLSPAVANLTTDVAKLSKLVTKYSLKSNVDSTLFELSTGETERANADLDISEVKSDINFTNLFAAFLANEITAGPDTQNLEYLNIPLTGQLLTRYKTFELFAQEMKSRMGIKFEFQTPGTTDSSAWKEYKDVKSLGNQSKIKIKVSFETNADKNFTIKNDTAAVTQTYKKFTIDSNKTFTFELPVQVPTKIDVDTSKLDNITLGGNTKDITIDQAKEQEILKALGANSDKVAIQYAIGSSSTTLADLTGASQFWFTRENFINNLRTYNQQFTLANKKIFVRYQIASGVDSSKFAVSSTNAVEHKNSDSAVALYVNIDDFAKQAADNAPSFGADDSTSNLTKITLGISTATGVDALELLAQANVEVKYSTSKGGTYSTTLPKELGTGGTTPELWMKFTVKDTSKKTELSTPAKATESEPIKLKLTNLSIILTVTTQDIVDLVKLSGNTKNITINTDDLKGKNAFAFANATPMFGIQLLTNNSDSNSIDNDLQSIAGQSKWMNASQLTTALTNIDFDIFLDRNNATSNDDTTAQKFRIAVKWEINESADNLYKIQENTIRTFQTDKLTNLKSFVRTANYVALLKQNVKGKRISFGGSERAENIIAIDFSQLPITPANIANLKTKGVTLNLGFGNNAPDSSTNWESDLTAGKSLMTTSNQKQLKLQFALISNDSNSTVDIENTEIVTKLGNDLVIPSVIKTNKEALKSGITLGGNTKTITVDETKAKEGITADADKVMVQYAIGKDVLNLLPVATGDASVWFNKDTFISSLSTYGKNIKREDLKIWARYQLGATVDTDTYVVSDSTPVELTSDAVALYLDLTLESFFKSLQNGSLIYPNATTNLALGTAVNPLTDEQKKLLEDNHVSIKWSLTKDGQYDKTFESLPSSITITTEAPQLWYKFETSDAAKTVLSDASKVEQMTSIDAERVFSLDTTNVLTNIELSGNTKDLVINEEKMKTALNSQFIAANFTVAYNLENITIPNVTPLTTHLGQNYYSASDLKSYLSSLTINILPSQKLFKARFVPGANVQLEGTNNQDLGGSLNSDNVKSYLHLDDLVDELKTLKAVTGENDSNASISTLTPPFTDENFPIFEQLVGLGLQLQFTNVELNGAGDFTNASNYPSAPRTTVMQGANASDYLYARFNAASTSNLFVDSKFAASIKMSVKSLKAIIVGASTLSGIQISGDTKKININNVQSVLNNNITDSTERNAVEVQFAIGDLTNRQLVKLDGTNTWYNQADFTAQLLSYPHTIYNKQIQARYFIKKAAEYSDVYKVSTTPYVIVDKSIGVNETLKVYVHKADLNLTNLLKLSNISSDVRVSGQSDIDLPQGLVIQYSNDGTIWSTTPPATLGTNKMYKARLAAQDGYVYEDTTTTFDLDTSNVLDSVAMQNLLNQITLTGNLKNLTIDDSKALEGVQQESAYKGEVVIRYSIDGKEINGQTWFTKDEFITLLNSLNGYANEVGLITRESIKARYDYSSTSAKKFVLSFGAVNISAENINDSQFSSFTEQLIVDGGINESVKGYVDTKVLDGLGLKDLKLSGTNNSPTLITTESFRNFLLTYNKLNPITINFDNNDQFNGSFKLFNATDIANYTETISLNTLLSSRSFSISSDAQKFGLQFKGSSKYVVATEGKEVDDYKYMFTDEQINILVERSLTQNVAPTITIAATNGNAKPYQGKTTVTVNNNSQTFDENLFTYWYLVTNVEYQSQQLKNLAEQTALWTQTKPENLKVGDLVYVKIDVKDPTKDVLVNPTNNYSTSALKVTGLYIDKDKLSVDTAKIVYAGNFTETSSSFDGLSRFASLPLSQDIDGNYLGVSVKLTTKLKFIKSTDGNIQYDKYGVPLIERDGVEDTTKPIMLNTGIAATNAEGQPVYYKFNTNADGVKTPGKPVVSTEEGDTVTMSLTQASSLGFFAQANNQSSQILFQDQKVEFTYALKDGYQLEDPSWLTTHKQEFTIDKLKYQITSDHAVTLTSFLGRFERASDRTTGIAEGTSGFAQLKDMEALIASSLTTDSTNGVETLKGFKAINTALKAIDPKLRLSLKWTRRSNNQVTVFNDLDNQVPNRIANGDQLIIKIDSSDERFAYNSREFSLIVTDLKNEVDLSLLQFVRIQTSGITSGSGTFEILTTNPETSEQVLPNDYTYEYAVIKDGQYNSSDSQLTWSTQSPTNLKNGDLVKWRLRYIGSEGQIGDNYANRIASVPWNQALVLQEAQVTVADKSVTVNGYLVKNLKTNIDIGNFSSRDLDKIVVSYEGDNTKGSLKYDLNNVTLPADTDIQFYVKRTTNGDFEKISDLTNANLKNGDQIQIRLIASAKAITENKVLDKSVVSSTKIVVGLKQSNEILNSATTIAIGVGVAAAAVASAAIAYVLIRRFKLKK